MLNKKTVRLISGSLCVVSAISNAKAQNFYLSAGLGYGETALNRPSQVTSFSRDGYAWSAFAGYQFHPSFSAELGYTRMHDVTASISGANIATTVAPDLTYLALKASLPLTPQLNGYGKLGAAYSYGKENLRVNNQESTSSQGETVPYIALGIDYRLNQQWSTFVNVSNAFGTNTVPRLSAVSAGFQYHFGEN